MCLNEFYINIISFAITESFCNRLCDIVACLLHVGNYIITCRQTTKGKFVVFYCIFVICAWLNLVGKILTLILAL